MSLLSASGLRARLEAGDIFTEASWSPDRIRGAAYDIEVATDWLIPPRDRPYAKGDHRRTAFVMRPGDTAVLASTERFCMRWNLAANIAVKYSKVRQGLLVLSGLLIDPGFGLEASEGLWRAKEDERLHVLVANVGATDISIHPGHDTLVAIQVFEIDVVSEEDRHVILGGDEFRNDFENETTTHLALRKGLGSFTDAVVVRKEIRNLQQRVIETISLGFFVLGVGAIGAAAALLVALLGRDPGSALLRWDTVAALVIWTGIVVPLLIACRRYAKLLAFNYGLSHDGPQPLAEVAGAAWNRAIDVRSLAHSGLTVQARLDQAEDKIRALENQVQRVEPHTERQSHRRSERRVR